VFDWELEVLVKHAAYPGIGPIGLVTRAGCNQIGYLAGTYLSGDPGMSAARQGTLDGTYLSSAPGQGATRLGILD
jgi:hypothetical protein